MKKAIKTMLAFAALMLCGGAWAATPVVIWDGDFTETSKTVGDTTYKLELNGNEAVGAKGSQSIAIKQDTDGPAGVFVKFENSSGQAVTMASSIIVHYKKWMDSSVNGHAALVNIYAPGQGTEGYKNLMGLSASANGKPSESWGGNAFDNSNNSYAEGTFTSSGCFGLARGDSGNPHVLINGSVVTQWFACSGAGNKAGGFLIGGIDYSKGRVDNWSNSAVTKIGALTTAAGLVIDKIAVFNSNLSDADLKGYVFPSLVDVSFDTPNGPTKAAEVLATGSLAFGNAAKYDQLINGRPSVAVKVIGATGNDFKLFGGRGENDKGDVNKDIWLSVEDGTFSVIHGASNAEAWQGSPKQTVTGNIVLEVGGNSVANYVYGGFWKDGLGATVNGDITVVVKDQAVVKGGIAGGGFSTHSNNAQYNGNVSVLVKNVQSDNTAGALISADSSDYIVGGGVYATNTGSKETVNGNTSVTIDIPRSVATSEFAKGIIGGGLIPTGGSNHDNAVQSKVNGNSSVIIQAPSNVTFSGVVVAGGYKINDCSGDATVSGSATVTVKGGTFTNAAAFQGGVASGAKTLVFDIEDQYNLDRSITLTPAQITGFDAVEVKVGTTLKLNVASGTETFAIPVVGDGLVEKIGAGTLKMTATTGTATVKATAGTLIIPANPSGYGFKVNSAVTVEVSDEQAAALPLNTGVTLLGDQTVTISASTSLTATIIDEKVFVLGDTDPIVKWDGTKWIDSTGADATISETSVVSLKDTDVVTFTAAPASIILPSSGKVTISGLDQLGTKTIFIPAETTLKLGSAASSVTFEGTGTLELAGAATNTQGSLASWIANANVNDFSGTVLLSKGRFQSGATPLPDGIKVMITDGAQLYMTGGTWNNHFIVSGNGWGGDSGTNGPEAIRADGNNYFSESAIIEPVKINGVIPCIGTHGSNSCGFNAKFIGNDGLRLRVGSGTQTITIAKAANCNLSGPVTLENANVKFGSNQGLSNGSHGKFGDTLTVPSGKSFTIHAWSTAEASAVPGNKFRFDTKVILDGGSFTAEDGSYAFEGLSLTADSTATLKWQKGWYFKELNIPANKVFTVDMTGSDNRYAYLTVAGGECNGTLKINNTGSNANANCYFTTFGETFANGTINNASTTRSLKMQNTAANSYVEYGTVTGNNVEWSAVAGTTVKINKSVCGTGTLANVILADGVEVVANSTPITVSGSITAGTTMKFKGAADATVLTLGTGVTAPSTVKSVTRVNNDESIDSTKYTLTTDGSALKLRAETNKAVWNDTKYDTLDAAITAAQAQATAANPQTVTLLADVETLDIPENIIIDVNDVSVGSVTGSGTILFVGKVPATTLHTSFQASTWTGTVWLKKVTLSGANFNNYGQHADNETKDSLSTIKLTSVDGWIVRSAEFYNDVILEDGDDGLPAFHITGSSNAGYIFHHKFIGDGTFKISGGAGDNGSWFRVYDVSEFTGTVETNRPLKFGNGNITAAQTSYIEVQKIFPATIGEGKHWTADEIRILGDGNGGATIRGAGELRGNVTFQDNSHVDITSGETLTITGSIGFNVNHSFRVNGVATEGSKVFTFVTAPAIQPGAIRKDDMTTEDGKCYSWVMNGNEYWVAPNSSRVAQYGDVVYATISSAIAAADWRTATITLLKSTTEDVTIPSNITLVIGANTLTGDVVIEGAVTGTGKIIFTGDNIPSVAPASGLTYRFEGETALPYMPFYNVAVAGVVEIARPLASITGDDSSSANVTSSLNSYIFDSGFTGITVGSCLSLGCANGANQNFVQKAGTITLTRTGSASSCGDSPFLPARYGVTVTYALQGGSILAENGKVQYWDGNSQMTIGGGENEALFSAKGFVSTKSWSSSWIDLQSNGTLKLSGDVNLASPATIKLNGGKIHATQNIAVSVADGIQVGATGGTIEVDAGKTMTISTALTGSGAITKIGAGTLKITGSLENFTGTINASAGYVIVDDSVLSKITTSNTGAILTTESATQYAQGNYAPSAAITAAVEAGKNVAVLRPNGSIASISEVQSDHAIKICGAATSFDITYTNVNAFAYKAITATANQDSALTYNNTLNDHTTAANLKHHPYVESMTAFYRNTAQLTFAVVGTMPSSTKTTFIHMGETRTGNDGGYGLLIATGTKKDEVTVSWNHGTEVNLITTISVPNAATERHVYIVTKDDVDQTSTFRVYLDGKLRKELAISRITIIGGIQVGSDFGGLLKDLPATNVNHYNQATTGLVNLIRGYDRVISQAEIDQYSVESEYPYHPPFGESSREFAADEATANWIEAEDNTSWAVKANGATEYTHTYQPIAGSAVTANFGGATTVTVNVPEAGLTYENLEITGTGPATFVKGTGSGEVKVSGKVNVYCPIVIEPGSLDISTPPVELFDTGKITFDYSDFDVSTIYETTKITLVGSIDQANEKIIFTEPTVSHPYHTFAVSYDVLTGYVLTITPNHEDGADVYINSNSYFDGSLDGKVDTTLEGTTKTAVFPNDTVVFAEGKTLPAWVGKPQCSKIKIAKDVTLGMGLTSDADHTAVAPALDGKTITITDGKTLTLNNADRSWSFGSVTMNGPGVVLVKGTVSATAIAGNATIKLADDATLTVDTALTAGRVIPNDNTKAVSTTTNEETGKVTYSVVEPVAKIVDGETTAYFATYEEAIAAADDDLSVIVVLEDEPELPDGYAMDASNHIVVAVARIDFKYQGYDGCAYVATLPQAFTAFGGTVTLLQDVEVAETFVMPFFRGILNFNGHTIFGAIEDGAVVKVQNTSLVYIGTSTHTDGGISNTATNGLSIENLGQMKVFDIELVGDVKTTSTSDSVYGYTLIEASFNPTEAVTFLIDAPRVDAVAQVGIAKASTSETVIIDNGLKLFTIGGLKYHRDIATAETSDGIYTVYAINAMRQVATISYETTNATISGEENVYTLPDGVTKFAYVGNTLAPKFAVTPDEGYAISSVSVNGDATRAQLVDGKYQVAALSTEAELTITVETAVGAAYTFETGAGADSNASYMKNLNPVFELCVPATEDTPAGSVIHVKSLVLGRSESANPEKLPDYIRIGESTYSSIVNGTGDPSTAARFSDNSYKQTYTFEDLDIVVGTSYPLAFTSDTDGTIPNESRWHLHASAVGPVMPVPANGYAIVAQLNGIIEKAPLALPTLEWGSNDNRETYLAINDEPSTYVFAGVTLADIVLGRYALSTWMAGALDRGSPWLKTPCAGTIFWTDSDASDKTVVFQSQCQNGTLAFSLVQKVQLTEVEFGGNTYITARDLGQFYVSGANAYKSLIEGPGTASDVNNHYIECVRLTLTEYITDGTTLSAESLLQPEGGLRIAPSATVMIDGAGAVITPNMELSDGAKLVIDPVRTPMLVNSKVAFGTNAKLSLASDYASVTCGKMTLFTYPTACTIDEAAITAAIVDADSFGDASYTVAVENSPKSGYKRVVLTIGDYASVPETTFLPLGDSITEGYTDGIGATGVPNYRIPLMEMLAAHGYKPVTRGYRTTNNQNAINMTADEAYQNHCGMVGHRILTGFGGGYFGSYRGFAGGYLQGVENYLAQAGEVDYITLLIGTNDIERSPYGEATEEARQQSCDFIFANWKTLIKRVVKQNPTSRIILTQIPVNSNANKELLTQLVNAKIVAYIGSDESVADGIPSEQVTLIDLHTACAGQFITASPLHPNWNGHIKNAAAWFAGIKAAEAKSFVKDETKLQTKTGIENTIPAAYTKGYVKLAEVDVKNIAKLSSVADHVTKIASKEGKTLTRVGYYVESQFANQTQTAYLWVDMPLWGEGTKTLADVSVPTTETTLVRDVVDGIHVYSAGAGVENVEPTNDTVKGIIVRTIKGLNGAAGTVLTEKGEPTPSASVYDWNDSANAAANWGAWQVFRINTPETGFTSASTLFTFGSYNASNSGNDFGIGDLAKHSESSSMSWIDTGSRYPVLAAGNRKAAKIEIWGKIEGAVVPEANEPVVVEAETEEEALAQTDIVIADEAAEAAGQTVDILKKVATDNGDGTWSIKVELNAEATIPNTEKTVQAAVEETAVEFAQQGLEAVAGATEETQVSIPAAKVVPGLYYSVSYGTTPDNHTDESDRVLATGSEGVTIPVPALGSEKVYYIKIKASATR